MNKFGDPRLPARFWSKVKIVRRGRWLCWVWQASNNYHYGRYLHDGKMGFAHRISYEVFNGPIPKGLHVHHLCHERLCVNPAHLEAMTQGENNWESGLLAFGKCRSGNHEIKSDEDIYHRPNQTRGECRQCIKERDAEIHRVNQKDPAYRAANRKRSKDWQLRKREKK